MDYRVNPGNLEKDRDLPYASMIPEAKEYLSQAGACFGTPIERLKHMNEPAILFYQDHHVDLFKERLRLPYVPNIITVVCPPTIYGKPISGLYAIGEVCASHGVTRPGGTALNAGQVGAVRAVEGIFLKKNTHERSEPFHREWYKRKAAHSGAGSDQTFRTCRRKLPIVRTVDKCL